MRGKRNILRLTVLLAALGVMLAGTASAHSGGGGPALRKAPGHHMGYRGSGMGHRFGRDRAFASQPLISIALRNSEELKLTDDQVTKLKNLRDGFLREMIRARADIKIMRLDLRTALDAEKVDMADVEKRLRAVTKKRTDVRLERLRTIQSGKALLTADQSKQLRELIKTRRSRRWAHYRGMGPGHQMRPGAGPPSRQ